MMNLMNLVIYALAMWGVIALYLVVYDLTRDFRYNLKRKIIRKYKSRYNVGDIVLICIDEKDRLCRITDKFVGLNWKTKEIEKTYHIKLLEYRLTDYERDGLWNGSTNSHEHFDRLGIYEDDLKMVL